MRIIGHLGFRKGSQGVKQKNLRLFLGKPLFMWSLEQLIECEQLSHFCVSTDHEGAYEQSLKLGGLDIGLRKPSLSNSTASKLSVWKDSIDKLENQGLEFDAILDLDCTAPMREMQDIEKCIKVFKKFNPDVCMSITEARKNPYFNIMEENQDGYLEICKGDGKIFSRQTAPKVFEHAASTYLISKKFLQNAEFLYDAKIKGFFMPPERAFDIDSELDWELAEIIFNKQKND